MTQKKSILTAVLFLLFVSMMFAIPIEDDEKNLIVYDVKTGSLSGNNQIIYDWNFNKNQYMAVSITPQETDGELSVCIKDPNGNYVYSNNHPPGETSSAYYKCDVSGTYQVSVYNVSSSSSVNYAMHWVKMDSETECFKVGVYITENMRNQHSSDYIDEIYEYLKFTSECFKDGSGSKLPCVFTIYNIERISSYSDALSSGTDQDVIIQFDYDTSKDHGGWFKDDKKRVDMFYTRSQTTASKTSYLSRQTVLLAHELGHYRCATELYNTRDLADYEDRIYIMANPHSYLKSSSTMYFHDNEADIIDWAGSDKDIGNAYSNNYLDINTTKNLNGNFTSKLTADGYKYRNYYEFQQTETNGRIYIDLTNVPYDADFDLFVKKGVPPTLSDYDYSSKNGFGDAEHIEFENTERRIHVMVYCEAKTGSYGDYDLRVESVYDDTPPSNNITSPGNNSTVSGNINSTSHATDGFGVKAVRWLIKLTGSKAEWVEIGYDNTPDANDDFTIPWNTSDYQNGEYSLKTIAYDEEDNEGEDIITVNIDNYEPFIDNFSTNTTDNYTWFGGTHSYDVANERMDIQGHSSPYYTAMNYAANAYDASVKVDFYRYEGSSQMAFTRVTPGTDPGTVDAYAAILYPTVWRMYRTNGGSWHSLTSGSLPTTINVNEWHSMTFNSIGSELTLKLDDEVVGTYTDASPLTAAGDVSVQPTWGSAYIDNLYVSDIGAGGTAKPLPDCEYLALAFNATSENGAVNLSWNSNSEKKYNVYRKTTKLPDEKWGKIGESANGTFIDSDVEPGKTYWYNIGTPNLDGTVTFFEAVSVTAGEALIYETLETAEKGLRVYPNPMSNELTIEYNVLSAGIVKIDVYDITGKQVQILTGKYNELGKHTIQWDGNDTNGSKMPNGTYFIRKQTEDNTQTTKFVLMR